MSLLIQIVQGQFKIRSNFIKTLETNLVFFRNKSKTVNVHFISINKIKRLNKQFLNKDKECSVLSFPLDVKCQMLNVKCNEIGDIFICKEVAKKKNFSVHYLLIHGLLHLAGLDHQSLSDCKKWDKIEGDIFNRLLDKYSRKIID